VKWGERKGPSAFGWNDRESKPLRNIKIHKSSGSFTVPSVRRAITLRANTGHKSLRATSVPKTECWGSAQRFPDIRSYAMERCCFNEEVTYLNILSFPCVTQLHMPVQRNALGVNWCILLSLTIFSHMFRLIWAIVRENQIKEKRCMKTLVYILTRMCSCYMYKTQQQI
jgi:hypothetical protein